MLRPRSGPTAPLPARWAFGSSLLPGALRAVQDVVQSSVIRGRVVGGVPLCDVVEHLGLCRTATGAFAAERSPTRWRPVRVQVPGSGTPSGDPAACPTSGRSPATPEQTVR